MTEAEKVIDKIRKLFAMATNAATSEAEAEAFMTKVHDLLAEHNLSDEVLNEQVMDRDIIDPINEDRYEAKYPQSWFATLASATAKLYFCGIYTIKRQNNTSVYVFIGRKDNRVTAIMMYDYLIKTMRNISRKKYSTPQDRYEFMKGFCWGVMSKIRTILEESKRPVESGHKNLPALYETEEKAIKNYMNHLTLRKPRTRSVAVSNTAIREGYRSGQNISLNRQVNSNINNPKKLT